MKLPTAERSESMGLCFVGERTRFAKFLGTSSTACPLHPNPHSLLILAEYIPPNPGPILLHPSLTQVGTHQGLWTLTIGQNARVPGQPRKLFVARKDIENNAIIVVDQV